MYHVMFEQKDSYDVAILIKTEALNKQAIEQHYIEPLTKLGISSDNFIAFSLEYFDKKKPTVSQMREYLCSELLPELKELNVKYLYCTDGNYFKVLTGQSKAEVHLGYVLPCTIPGYEHMHVVFSMNYRALFMNDAAADKIVAGNHAIADHYTGVYTKPGSNIIHYAKYLYDPAEICQYLETLKEHPVLTVDIEAFSLRHTEAGLGTIGFAWSKHSGVCINVEHDSSHSGRGSSDGSCTIILAALRNFFETYTGKIIFHNATYDIKVLIYKLWMNGVTDTEGLLQGLEVMTRNFEDTKVIAYLCLNSCYKSALSLKELAQAFAGNYAQDDIHDITLIPSSDLMQYNLVDCLSTMYVYEKYLPMLHTEAQADVYNSLFKPMIIQGIQMELTGMPLNMDRVIEVDRQLESIYTTNLQVLKDSQLIKDFLVTEAEYECAKRNAKLKKKVLSVEDVSVSFNAGSNQQLARLLHDYLGYPVVETTDTGSPAVGGDVLKGHLKRTSNPSEQEVLTAILHVLECVKIRSTFLQPMLNAVAAEDGWHYLFGSFVIGGTKSGRLSSKSPNLQNLPSGSTYGKLIKSCFQAPPGWVFVCSDYAALEDRVNTLLTKDPNKLKIYLGHTVYELTVDGTKQLIRDDAVVHYKGSTYTSTELYNLLGGSNGKTN